MITIRESLVSIKIGHQIVPSPGVSAEHHGRIALLEVVLVQ